MSRSLNLHKELSDTIHHEDVLFKWDTPQFIVDEDRRWRPRMLKLQLQDIKRLNVVGTFSIRRTNIQMNGI